MSEANLKVAKIIFVFENENNNEEKKKTWAFIDMQNLFKSVHFMKWAIDWARFRLYLLQEQNVTRALVFMGYLKENIPLYYNLQKAGFEIHFRTVKKLNNGKIDGGNIDADLASCVMDHKNEYDKAIIIADDGDYCQMVKSLNMQNKLKLVISSHTIKETSGLIKEALSGEQIISIHDLKNLVEYKKKNEK